jgi:hypothetical protein
MTSLLVCVLLMWNSSQTAEVIVVLVVLIHFILDESDLINHVFINYTFILIPHFSFTGKRILSFN